MMRPNTRRGRLFPLLALLIAGCLDPLPDPAMIEGLRVVAITAEPPEAAEGASVTLSALVIDGLGDAVAAAGGPKREIKRTWLACLKPERGQGFFSGASNVGFSGGQGYSVDDPGSCFNLLEAEVLTGFDYPLGDILELGSDESVRLTVPTNFVTDPEKLGGAYGIPAERLSPPALAILSSVAGLNLTVGLRVEVDAIEGAPADVVESFKRVNVSTATPKNMNPTGLLFHLSRSGSPEDNDETAPLTGEASRRRTCFGEPPDAPVTVDRDATWVLRALNIPDEFEKYQVLLGSTDPSSPFGIQERDETYFYSVFSTHGSFSERVFKSRGSAKASWEIPSDAPATIPLWVVVRDGRGGAAWCHSTLNVIDELLVPASSDERPLVGTPSALPTRP
ncbi:MAG: hypothetical protein IV100_27430 [Myxococcales bacterium]|nr:hypothetical protein [Myxococcales bacterium]